MPHDVVLQAQVFGLGVEMDPLQGLAGPCRGAWHSQDYQLPAPVVLCVVSELYMHVQGTKNEIVTRFHPTEDPG